MAHERLAAGSVAQATPAMGLLLNSSPAPTLSWIVPSCPIRNTLQVPATPPTRAVAHAAVMSLGFNPMGQLHPRRSDGRTPFRPSVDVLCLRKSCA